MEIGEEEESWLKIGVPGAGSPNSCIRLKENTSELLLEDKNSTYGTYYSEKGLQLRVGEGRPVPVIRVG